MTNRFLERMTSIKDHGRSSEKRAAKAMGARLQPSSGAMAGAKGDAFVGQFLMEMKCTVTQRLQVDLGWLKKITDEAKRFQKSPALVFSFVTPEGKLQCPEAEWVAVPKSSFLELIHDK
jgi:hypothetical protein